MGYSSASPAERIYPGSPDQPQAGILLYTAAPDSEGTLGGLAALAAADTLARLVTGALADAAHCSSDPLCAERLPDDTEDFLHGAVCHVCLFVSETTCERVNRFLDRRLLADIDPRETPRSPRRPVNGALGEAARAAVKELPSEHVEWLAQLLAGRAPAAAVTGAVALPGYRDAAARVLAADDADPAAAAAYLRALAEGYALGRAVQRVEVVWSGPTSSAVPVRATARVLAALAAEAARELDLNELCRPPYAPPTAALAALTPRRGGES